MDELSQVTALLEHELPFEADALARVGNDLDRAFTWQRDVASKPATTWRQRKRWFAVPVIAIGAVAAVVILETQPPPPITQAFTTPISPARPLPATRVDRPRSAPAGTWQLAAYITKEGWQLNSSGPKPGTLTCPTATTCYSTSGTATSALESTPNPIDSLYVTEDGARSWSVLALPNGLTFTTPLTCPDAETCLAGAAIRHQPVLLRTVDGGHQWTVKPLPTTITSIGDLACQSSENCSGLASGSDASTSRPQNPAISTSGEFIVTTDGGASWTTHPFPGETMTRLSCSDSMHCVAVGVASGAVTNFTQMGVAAITDDGGVTWSNGSFPPSFTTPYAVACPDSAHCWALGWITIPNPGPRSLGQGGFSSTDEVNIPVSAVASSSDGGATWALRPVGDDVPEPGFSSISCPVTNSCWVAGEEAVTQQIGDTVNGGSAVVLETHDSGSTWKKITFDVPANAPNDKGGDAYMSVGTIQCPSVTACIGLGVSDQGSTTTPVYTMAGG